MGVCISSPSEKLVAAADGGNLGAVKRLLSRLKNEPNFHDPTTGLTPLLAAAAKGHVPVVKLLLDSGASVTARVSTKGRQALHFAADSGNVEVAELLVSYGANVNATAGGMSPLMLAATQPHTEMCHYLLEQGAVPDMKGPDAGQLTAVHMTIPARRVDNLRAMLQITRDCVDVEAANGVTPLMLAGTWGSLEATQCLVEAGADLFARASLQHRGPSDKVASLSDCQVLHFVSCAGFKRELQTQALLETAQALADAGADPLACTAEGLLPVDLVMDRMGPLGVLMVELTEAAARRKQREMQLSSRASDTSSGQGQLRPTSRGAVGPEAVGLDRLGSLRPMPRRAESSQLLEAGGAGGRSDARVQSHGAASPAGRSRRMSAVLPMSPPGGSTFKSLKGSELSGPGYASYRAGASAGYGHAGAQGTGGSSQSGGDTRDSSDGGSRGTNRYGWAGRGEHAGAGNSSRETSGRSLAPLSPPQGGRRGSAEYASLEGRLTPPLQRSLRRPAASLDGRRMREAAQSLTTARNGDGAAADAGRRLDWAQTGNRGGTAPSPFVRASEGQGAKGGPSPGGYADGGAGVMPWGLQPQGRRPRPEDSTSLDGSAASQRSRATTPVGGVLASSGGSSESLSGPTRVTRRE